jgi:tetratricopeptide (TPR) repeat protein
MIKLKLYLFLVFPLLLYSQNQDNDLNLLESNSYENTVKANKFHEFISNTYLERQTDSAYLLTRKLVAFTEKHNLEKEKADAQLLLADILRVLNENADATKNVEQSLKIYKKLNHRKGIAKALMSIGVSYRRVHNLDEAKNYYQQALDLSREIKDTTLISKGLLNLSNIYSWRYKTDEALKYLKESEALAKTQKSQRDLGAIYVNMASLYGQKKDYNTALNYIEKAIIIGESLNNYYLLTGAYNTKNFLYFQQKKYDHIVESATKQLRYAKRISDNKNIGAAYYFLSEAYKGKKNADSLIKYVELKRTTDAVLDNVKNLQALNKIKIDQEIAKDSLLNVQKLKQKEEAFKKEKNNLTLLWGLVLFCVLVILIFSFRKNKLTKLEVLELQELVDELNNSKVDVKITETTDTIILKSKVVLNTNDILYLKSDGHYIDYFLEGKPNPEVDRNSLAKVLEELPKDQFSRTHRSYIVNVNRIKIINSTQLMLNTGEWIPLSRTYKPALKELLNKK